MQLNICDLLFFGKLNRIPANVAEKSTNQDSFLQYCNPKEYKNVLDCEWLVLMRAINLSELTETQLKEKSETFR